MPVIAVVGAQWGDEGKGRVVDYLASSGASGKAVYPAESREFLQRAHSAG